MTVRELMTILQDFHPDEDVALFALSNKFMQILGLDVAKTSEKGMPILSVDWSINKDQPRETPREKLERQAALIQEAIEKIDKKEVYALKKTVSTKNKVHRSDAEMLLNGLIPTQGKRGRPRKIITEKDFEPKKVGRHRKDAPIEKPKPKREHKLMVPKPRTLIGDEPVVEEPKPIVVPEPIPAPAPTPKPAPKPKPKPVPKPKPTKVPDAIDLEIEVEPIPEAAANVSQESNQVFDLFGL